MLYPVTTLFNGHFIFNPKKCDTLQRGIVQPAFGHNGGGDEVYFAKGTSNGTFIQQTSY